MTQTKNSQYELTAVADWLSKMIDDSELSAGAEALVMAAAARVRLAARLEAGEADATDRHLAEVWTRP